MTFTDDFNRPNEGLEASANWTRVDGAANAAAIQSNEVYQFSTTNSAYQCPDQATPDHYTQVVSRDATPVATNGFYCCTRVTDSNNFFGVRHNNTAYQLYKRNAGSFTLIGSYTVGHSDGDIVRLESDSSDVHTFKLNGTTRVTSSTDTFNNTETRQGLVVRTNSGRWFDDFEAGALAAPSGRIMSSLAGYGGLAGHGGIAGKGGGLAG